MSKLIFTDIAKGRFYNADCFDAMVEIPDGCVDMILCDLPYGTTSCKWDSVIPFEPLWLEIGRVCRTCAPVVLTASEPFTSLLVTSNIKEFRHRWIWDKVKPASGLNAKNSLLGYRKTCWSFARSVPFITQLWFKRNIVLKRSAIRMGKRSAERVLKDFTITAEWAIRKTF